MAEEAFYPLSSPLDIRVQPAKDIQGPPDAYKNDSTPRGAVFIANYKHFQSPLNIELETRHGSEKDIQYLQEMFCQAGYTTTEQLVDGDFLGTKESLKKFRDEKILDEVDSLIVIFMSHGMKNDILYTSDGESLSCESIITMFNNTACPALQGKPKLFIFQMCRGTEEHVPLSDISVEAVPINSSEERNKKSDRKISDVFIGFSSLSGFVSYRHNERGSAFINNACKVFMDCAKNKSFNSLMREVNKRTPEAMGCNTQEWITSNDLFFNPMTCKELETEDCSTSSNQENGKCQDDKYRSNVEPSTKKTHNVKLHLDTYNTQVCGKSQGVVMIVNNLPGCQSDVIKLKGVFSELGYDVMGPFSDLTREQLLQKTRNLKKGPSAHSLIVLFYGGGFEDCIVSSDDKVISYQEFLKPFHDVNCPNLKGKPKVFILNTCFHTGDVTGGEPSTDMESESPSAKEQDDIGPTDGSASNANPQQQSNSIERDMLMYSVEVDGQCESGSLLTEALYQILLSSDGTLEIMPLLRLVNRRLKQLQRDGEMEYFAEIRNFGFHKDFYIIPFKSISTLTTMNPVTPTTDILLRSHFNIPPTICVKEIKIPISGKDIYVHVSSPRGMALIICLDTYDIQSLPSCSHNWRRYEAELLENVLKQCGYKVYTIHNKPSSVILAALHDHMHNAELENMDSALIIVLGLAQDRNTYYSSDGSLLPLANIYQVFTNTGCPVLKGKPKIFFFHMTFLQSSSEPRLEKGEDLHDSFILRLCSNPRCGRFVSHPTLGLETLIRKLADHAHDTHLERIVSMVEETLAANTSCERDLETFTRQYVDFSRKFYFNPKNFNG